MKAPEPVVATSGRDRSPPLRDAPLRKKGIRTRILGKGRDNPRPFSRRAFSRLARIFAWYPWPVMSASQKRPGEMSDGMAKLIGYSLAAIFFAIILSPFLLFINRREIDRAGWIPHRHTVDVYIQGDWFDGENRVCSGIQTKRNDKSPKEISAIHCPPDPVQPYGGTPSPSTNISTHNLSVVFWGRVSRPGIRPEDELSGKRFEWNCTRKDDRFVCHAIN